MTRTYLWPRANVVGVLAFVLLVGGLATAAVGSAASGSGGVATEDSTEAVAADSDGVFPVRGKHTYGDGLGAGRNHQGQDLLAKCGKAVVAAQPGRVSFRGYDGGGAGNYVVIDGKRNLHDTVYMHLLKRASVSKGQRVSAGQVIGRVGSTGRSTACHLHFEMWSPRWSAGKPVDPEPYLRRWDR